MTWLKTCFLSLVAGCALWAETTWVIDPDKLQTELPSDVEPQALIDILKVHGIDVSLQEKTSPLLWQGNNVAIYLARHPQTPYHLWVEVSGRKSLQECKAEELQELYRACWSARKALSDIIGAHGFLIFHVDSPRLGKTSDSVGFEILPAMLKDQIDAVEKSHLNDYMFFGTKTAFLCPLPMAAQKTALKEAIQKYFVSYERSDCSRLLIDPPLQQGWTQNLLHKNGAAETMIKNIFCSLQESGVLAAGAMPSFPPDTEVVPMKINTDTCAFCNPAVLQKQTVLATEHIYLLHSHKPLCEQGSFLLLPKRHKIAWDLTDQEVVDAFRIVQQLKPKLEARLGGEAILYIQDGPACGQTVPHTHFHLLGIPSPMKHDITGLQHNQNLRKVVPVDQLKEMCREWAETIGPLR